MSVDITAVLATHREGRMLVPTLRSILDSVRDAEADGIRVQVVVVEDRIDEETRRVLDVHLPALAAEADVVEVPVDNGDLGASRNDGVRRADAAVITVLDGDNLISRGWLRLALRAVESGGDGTIVHPEVIVSFGYRQTLWWTEASTGSSFRAEMLAAVNLWDACVAAHRSVFRDVPYRVLRPADRFGPEDWTWNLDTISRGHGHHIARGTALFYRARADSLLTQHAGSLLPPCSFLSDMTVAERVSREWTRPVTASVRVATRGSREWIRETVPHRVRRPASILLRGARSVIRPWVHGARRLRGGSTGERRVARAALPDWLVDDWRAANLREPAVPFPRAETMDGYVRWGAPWAAWDVERAAAYWRVVAALRGRPDFLFVAPWVRTGGGDSVLLQYIAAVRRLQPRARITLMTTEPEPSTRLQDVPPGVEIIDLRSFESRWVDRAWIVDRLLPQILVQLPPRTLHVFNSTVGFDVLERFGRQIATRTSIFVSTFVLDRTYDGERTSVLFYRHPDFLANIESVLVDSDAFADVLVSEQGFDRRKFVTNRQIVRRIEGPVTETRAEADIDDTLVVLWAGRFDLQKRLDVLASVQEELVRRGLPIRIEFYGEEVMGDPTLDHSLSRLDAAGARRKPPFRDFDSLPLDTYGAFLLTSEWEGVPNAMLEAMAAGLAVVGPAVGGIPEVLDERVGFPVARFDDVSGYVEALEQILRDPAEARVRGARARELMRSAFSQHAFDRRLQELDHYLTGRIASGGADSLTFFADEATQRLLGSTHPRAYLFCGSAGTANFGDILQPKNVIDLWRSYAPTTPTILFFAVESAGDAEHVAQLTAWYGCAGIVFYSAGSEVPAHLAEIAIPPVDGRLHVIGGGFLNSRWGARFLEVIGEIAQFFRADSVLMSGMQVDERIIPSLQGFADSYPLVAFGARDEESAAIARAGLGAVADYSFDDLSEAIAPWRAMNSAPDEPFRLGLHINASAYVGGTAVIAEIRDLLRVVLDRHPDAQIVLLNAYDDPRPEVLDTLASHRLFGDDFPFTRFEVVDLARVALEADLTARDTPDAIAQLRLDAAVTCSYHTTLLMHAIGVPAYLVRLNDYYRQKAALFALPDDFGAFLDDPARFLRVFESQEGDRAAWLARQVVWMRGGDFPASVRLEE